MTGHETEDEKMGKKEYELSDTVDMGNEEYAEMRQKTYGMKKYDRRK